MLAAQSADISIMDGAVELGLILARDSSGRPVYREKEMQPFSFMQAAGYLDETSMNPQAMYPLAFQKSWVGGFGQAFMKSNEPRRYFASYGVDASEEGVLKLGPYWNAVAWPTIATYAITDGGLEIWASATDLTNWTETITGSGTVDRSTAQVHGGTYSALLTVPVGDSALISQGIATWNTEFRGKRFTATCWVYQAGSGAGTIKIYDGIGTTTGATSATTGAWVQLTVSRVLNAAATSCTIQIVCADSLNVYVDDVAITGYTIANTNSYAEYAGLQYMSLGDILFKANSATAPTSWTYVDNYISNITALYAGQVSGTAYLFVMIGSGNALVDRGWYWNGSTSTQMTDAGGTDASGDYMTMATTTFYISGRPTGVTTGNKFVIRTNTAPLAGAWSSDTNVGDPNTNITGLVNVNNVIYIAKEDSLWKVNTDGTVSMVVDYRLHTASTSGVGITGWVGTGKVYIPVGVNSLLEYDPDSGSVNNISPAATASSVTQAQIATGGAILSAIQTDFDGRIMRVTGGNEYLWVLQDNGSVNNLFKGQYSNIDGAGWHWHPVANTTMADVNCMAMSSLTGAPIIWVGHGTGNPGYYNLALYTITDPTYTNPMIITPYYTGGVWRMMKALYSIILGLESITATVYVTLQYRFYGTTAWSAPALIFDGLSGTVTNGQDSNFMPADSFGTAIQFRLNFISGSTSSTPKVTRINGEGIIKPAEVSIIECTVVLQDNQLTRLGTRDTMPASRKLSGLNAIRASNWPVTFFDILGNQYSVDLVTREDAAAPEVRHIGPPVFRKSLLLKKVNLS